MYGQGLMWAKQGPSIPEPRTHCDCGLPVESPDFLCHKCRQNAHYKEDDLIYQCPHCDSKNCGLIHNDVFAAVDVIMCFDCDEEFTVDAGTDLLAAYANTVL